MFNYFLEETRLIITKSVHCIRRYYISLYAGDSHSDFRSQRDRKMQYGYIYLCLKALREDLSVLSVCFLICKVFVWFFIGIMKGPLSIWSIFELPDLLFFPNFIIPAEIFAYFYKWSFAVQLL